MPSSKKIVWVVGCIVASIGSSRSMAGDLSFGAGYAGTYTNLRQSIANPLPPPSTIMQERPEEWMNSYIFGFSYVDPGPVLSANIAGAVEYRDYTRGTYDNETLGNLAAAAVWAISPQRFHWTFVDHFGQVPRDSTSTTLLTPSDRETVNSFETGPDYFLPITRASTLVIGARYRNVWFKESTADQQSVSIAARWRQRLDATTVLSANIETSKNQSIDSSSAPTTGLQDYQRDDAYLRYDQRIPSYRFIADLGATRIAPEGSVAEVTEPLIRLNVARRTGVESSIGLAYGHELMSIGSALLSGIGDPTVQDSIGSVPSVSSEMATGEIYISRHADAFYALTGSSLNNQTSVYYRNLDYLGGSSDVIVVGLREAMQYPLSPLLWLNIEGATQKSTLQDTNRLDREFYYAAAIYYRLAPLLSLGVEARRTVRISSDPLNDFEEVRGVVSLNYSSSPLYRPAARR